MARSTNRHSRDPTILVPQEAAMTTPRSLDLPGTDAQSLPPPHRPYEQDPMWTRLHFFYFLAAAAIFLGLHAYFVMAWDSLYAHYPWRGYAPGVSPPFFSSSPRSQVVAYAVLFATSLGLTLLPSGRKPGVGIAMWAGIMAATVLIWVATPRLRNDSNLWPLDFVFLAFMTGMPMLIARAIGLLYWRVRIGQKLNLWVVGSAIAALVLMGRIYLYG
jgi:hypothetical protein